MARRKNLKRPSLKSGKNFQIQDIEPTPIDYNKLPPLFSLKHMSYQGSYCISRCQQVEQAEILNKIQRLSQATWAEIRGWDKKMGFEPMPPHRFQAALPSILTPDVTILVARYDQTGRMAGFRENDVYHIVLVGRDLYSH